VPAETKPEPKRTVKEEPDAIPIPTKQKEKEKRKAERERPLTAKLPPQKRESNQMTSASGSQASAPLFAPAAGSGGVGVGNGAPFGYQFGAYAAIVRDRVAAKWRTDAVEAGIRALPIATISFEISRDGRVRNIQVTQSSGNRALDYSAQRAITDAAPFPPLPLAYSGSSATVDFNFRLQR
jgi:protein TonB